MIPPVGNDCCSWFRLYSSKLCKSFQCEHKPDHTVQSALSPQRNRIWWTSHRVSPRRRALCTCFSFYLLIRNLDLNQYHYWSVFMHHQGASLHLGCIRSMHCTWCFLYRLVFSHNPPAIFPASHMLCPVGLILPLTSSMNLKHLWGSFAHFSFLGQFSYVSHSLPASPDSLLSLI